MKKIKVLGVCAGNGLCLYPFLTDDFEIIGNIEPRGVFYDKGNKQWQANFPGIIQTRNAAIRKGAKIIIGHPDCGHASVLRLSRAKKNISAKDNQSLILYTNMVTHHQPEVFLLENLPGLLKTHSEEDFRKIFDNYNLKFNISSVSNYGNSQVSRERLVIVGVRKDIKKSYFKLPEAPLAVKSAEMFELGESENPRVGHVREPLAKTCNLYYEDKRQITYSLAQHLWLTKFKHTSKWPVGGKMKNQPGVSKNMVGKPPFTVRKQNRQFGTLGLVLSPREMANIQGAPKSFKLYIGQDNKIYWINKARLTVTKTMPFEIAQWFAKKALKTLKRD